MAPFLNRGAESLANRGVAEGLGLIIVIASLNGIFSKNRKLAYVIGAVGLLSVVWAGVGPWLHHVPGTFDCLVFGLIFMALSWAITRTLHRSTDGQDLSIHTEKACFDQVSYQQGSIQLEGQLQEDQQKLSVNFSVEDIIKAVSMLSDEDFARVMRMLVLKHEALHVKRRDK